MRRTWLWATGCAAFWLAATIGAGGAESVWLESERSDKPFRVALAAEVLREHAPGDRIAVEVTALGDRRGKGAGAPRGRVVSMIAASDDPDRAAKGLMRAYEISGDWKPAVKKPSQGALAHRRSAKGHTPRPVRHSARHH